MCGSKGERGRRPGKPNRPLESPDTVTCCPLLCSHARWLSCGSHMSTGYGSVANVVYSHFHGSRAFWLLWLSSLAPLQLSGESLSCLTIRRLSSEGERVGSLFGLRAGGCSASCPRCHPRSRPPFNIKAVPHRAFAARCLWCLSVAVFGICM